MKFIAIAVMSVALVAVSAAGAHGPSKHAKKAQSPEPNAFEEKPFGRAGDASKVDRVVEVSMSDRMRYEPSEIRVRAGETVRFVVRNDGKLLHEIVLGTLQDLKEHAEMMRKHPGMEHDEPHMAHVQSGGKEDLVWQFTKPGEFHFACLIPGHFEAGMSGRIIVAGN